MDGKVSEELIGEVDACDFLELQRLEEGLDKLEERSLRLYEGHEIFVDAGPYGAISWEVQKMIFDKIARGETLTDRENRILSLGAELMGTRSYLNKYPAKYSRGTWTGTGPNKATSPYFADFKLMIDQLEAALKYYGLIRHRDEINSILPLRQGLSIDQELYQLNKFNLDGTESSRVNWNKNEETLNTWLVYIIDEIELSSKVHDISGAIQIVKEIFDNYYKKSEYAYKHPLYQSAKLTLYRTGKVLLESGVMTEFSLDKLDDLLKSINKPASESFYKNLQRNPTSAPRPSTVTNLRDNIILAADSVPNIQFTQSHKDVIIKVFGEYRDKVETYRLSKDKLKDYTPTYRLQLIQNLLDKCEPLRKVMAISMREFNKLVFKKDYKSLTTGFLRYDSRPVHTTIFEIIYNANEWSTKTFTDLGISLTYPELEELRRDIKEIVFDWITKAKYKPPLFNGKLLRSSDPVAPELELVLSLWFAARRKTNNPDLDFDNIYQLRLFGDSPLQYNLKEGSKFVADSVKLFKKTIQDWIIQESNKPHKDERKILSYRIALKTIGFYAQLRRIDFRGSIKGRSPSDRGDFNKEQAKIYNVILGLGRHLGFDPAFFRPIQDQMFDMNEGVKQMFKELGRKLYIFIRHHFKNNPNRASISISDQVLIDTRSHSFWENIMGEDDALVATQVLENLIKYDHPVTEIDIKNEFKKFGNQYLWIMANWISQPKFAQNLQQFNDRKDDIKSLRIDNFIKDHYSKAYNKFIKTLLKTRRVSVLGIIQAMHPDVDVSELVNLGTNDDHIGPYSRVFTEILRMYKYPIYF